MEHEEANKIVMKEALTMLNALLTDIVPKCPCPNVKDKLTKGVKKFQSKFPTLEALETEGCGNVRANEAKQDVLQWIGNRLDGLRMLVSKGSVLYESLDRYIDKYMPGDWPLDMDISSSSSSNSSDEEGDVINLNSPPTPGVAKEKKKDSPDSPDSVQILDEPAGQPLLTKSQEEEIVLPPPPPAPAKHESTSTLEENIKVVHQSGTKVVFVCSVGDVSWRKAVRKASKLLVEEFGSDSDEEKDDKKDGGVKKLKGNPDKEEDKKEGDEDSTFTPFTQEI
jgi:hypothetical protein